MRRSSLIALCVLVVLGPSRSPAQVSHEAEYRFKAAYLYNFLRFMEWPDSVFPGSPTVIGILGYDPFGSVLDDIVADETVNGRPVTVERFSRPEDVVRCHLLFVSGVYGNYIGDILTSVPRGTVTVGETKAFARLGGAINFYITQDKLRFEINEHAIAKTGVKVSSKLLRLSRLVNENAGGRE